MVHESRLRRNVGSLQLSFHGWVFEWALNLPSKHGYFLDYVLDFILDPSGHLRVQITSRSVAHLLEVIAAG